MNALNEVNKVISNVSYYTHKHSHVEDEEWLTAGRMAVSNIHVGFKVLTCCWSVFVVLGILMLALNACIISLSFNSIEFLSEIEFLFCFNDILLCFD